MEPSLPLTETGRPARTLPSAGRCWDRECSWRAVRVAVLLGCPDTSNVKVTFLPSASIVNNLDAKKAR